jgi:NhaP-type Na+/H+ or K+/H+ antiporter
MPLAVGFALGAIAAPTDGIALLSICANWAFRAGSSAAIAQRFRAMLDPTDLGVAAGRRLSGAHWP